jgi:hypothetical protein
MKALAAMAGTTHTTISRLERECNTRKTTIEAVMRCPGSGQCTRLPELPALHRSNNAEGLAVVRAPMNVHAGEFRVPSVSKERVMIEIDILSRAKSFRTVDADTLRRADLRRG